MRSSGECCVLLVAALLLSACSQPEKSSDREIVRLPTPVSGLTIEIESTRGHGPLGVDDVRLYAVLKKGEDAGRRVVLRGEDLTIARVDWYDAHNATICLKSGYTRTFENRITVAMKSYRDNYWLHFNLWENCASAAK